MMIGERFGRLVVVALGEPGYRDRPRWVCRCDCGGEAVVQQAHLRNSHTKSCGCFRRDVSGANGRAMRTHGHTSGGARSPTWMSWSKMLERCTNPRHVKFRLYGGRGIEVCDRWRSFENFVEDMGERPIDRTLDRIDPDGNYEPGNCRWATTLEQRHNRSKRC